MTIEGRPRNGGDLHFYSKLLISLNPISAKVSIRNKPI